MAKDEQRFRPAVRIGSSKMAPLPLLQGCTNTDAYAYVAPSTTGPVTISPGQTLQVAATARAGFRVEEFTAARFWFGGVGAGGTINYTVIGFYQIGATWFSMPIAAGVATLGTSTAVTTDLGAAVGDLLADTITDTLDLPGVKPYSPADNTLAHLDVDIRNFQIVQVHLHIAATATAMNCYYQRFEAGVSLTIGDIEASLGTLDDVVKAEDAAHGSGDKGIMTLAVRTDTRASLAGTTGDYAPVQLTASGDLRTRDDDAVAALAAIQAAADPGATRTIERVSITATTNDTFVIKAAQAGKEIAIHELWLTCSVAGEASLKSIATALTGEMSVLPGSVIHIGPQANHELCIKGATNEAMNLVLTTASAAGFAVISY